jgi:hypothetical protein
MPVKVFEKNIRLSLQLVTKYIIEVEPERKVDNLSLKHVKDLFEIDLVVAFG